MIARIVIKEIVIEKRTDRYSLDGSKEGFVKNLIKEQGVWDYKGVYFYPYHTIDKIEFR